MKQRILSLITVFALTALASTATAQEGESAGAPDKPISAGLLLGYGISLEDGSNPWGLGFGLGGGYTLDMGVYVGARFVYYLGEDDFNVWELGAEGGYAIDMDKLTIRPGLGLGIANLSVPSTTIPGVGTVGGSSTDLYIAPGAALLYDVSDSMFIGADVRLQLVFADPDMVKALILLANGGMRF